MDVGVELYLVDRSFLSASIGWVHPVYHGVDLNRVQMYPTREPVMLDVAADTFTFKVGIGL